MQQTRAQVSTAAHAAQPASRSSGPQPLSLAQLQQVSGGSAPKGGWAAATTSTESRAPKGGW